MSNLRKALRLAAELDKTADFQMRAIEAAAELRRLYEVNQILIDALEKVDYYVPEKIGAKRLLKYALAKAKEQA